MQNVPDSVGTAVADTAELFLPSWAKKVFGTCRNMYKLWNSGDYVAVSERASMSAGVGVGGSGGSGGSGGGSGGVGVGGSGGGSAPEVMASCDSSTVLMSSLVAFGVQTFVHIACSKLFGTEGEDHMLAALSELRTLLVGVGQEVRAVRVEMHGRFDLVDQKLDCIHRDLVAAEAAVTRQIAGLRRVQEVGFRCVATELSVVSRKLAALQDMCGDLACDVTWSALESTVLDVQLFPARFGAAAKPLPSQLRSWMGTIEDALLSSRTRAAMRWMTKAYLVSEAHSASMDRGHFRALTTPSDAVGWLTNGRVCYMPFDMYAEVLQVYHALRLWAQSVCTDVPYDAKGVCCHRITAAVRDVVIGPGDVSDKFAAATSMAAALACDKRALQARWDMDQEADCKAWVRRQEDRWLALAAPITHLDNRIVSYSNSNHEEVKWYALQLRYQLRDEYLQEVRAGVAGGGPVVIVIPPMDPVPDSDTDTMVWTKKPFILSGGNREVVLGTLGHFFDAERLAWGSLRLELKATQKASASVFGYADAMVDVVPWALAVCALWDGVQIAEFAVASHQFCAGDVCATQLTRGGMRCANPWGTLLWDGTATTHYVQHQVFGIGDTVLSVSAVDGKAADRMAARLKAHAQQTAGEKAAALAVDEGAVGSLRACVRWLILLGHVQSTTMDKLDAADYTGVHNDLRAASSTMASVKEWRVPYHQYAHELLLAWL
jgi:hypothetical protein